jgi:hypothetical protein
MTKRRARDFRHRLPLLPNYPQRNILRQEVSCAEEIRFESTGPSSLGERKVV